MGQPSYMGSYNTARYFPRFLSLATPFLVNRNDYWIVGYWLSTFDCWCYIK